MRIAATANALQTAILQTEWTNTVKTPAVEQDSKSQNSSDGAPADGSTSNSDDTASLQTALSAIKTAQTTPNSFLRDMARQKVEQLKEFLQQAKLFYGGDAKRMARLLRQIAKDLDAANKEYIRAGGTATLVTAADLNVTTQVSTTAAPASASASTPETAASTADATTRHTVTQTTTLTNFATEKNDEADSRTEKPCHLAAGKNGDATDDAASADETPSLYVTSLFAAEDSGGVTLTNMPVTTDGTSFYSDVNDFKRQLAALSDSVRHRLALQEKMHQQLKKLTPLLRRQAETTDKHAVIEDVEESDYARARKDLREASRYLSAVGQDLYAVANPALRQSGSLLSFRA